jgi:hypothetical protein
VLDDVALGPFLEDPARKDAIPFIVALILHRQLDEGAGFGRIFPRRGRLARAQPHDRAADARGVAGLHLELADQPVALVEEAEHRDAFGHRSRAGNAADFLRHGFGSRDLGRFAAPRLVALRAIAPGQRRRREQQHQRGGERARHRYAHSAPGRQAS